LLLPSSGFCQKVFNYSLTKCERQCEQKNPVLTVQWPVQKHCSLPCTGKGVLICFSFGHLGQRYIAETVKCFVQCHVFAQSPPCQRPKHPVNTSQRSQFVLKRFTSSIIGSNANSLTLSAQSHRYSSQYRGAGRGKGIKIMDSSQCRVSRKPSACHFGDAFRRFCVWMSG